MDTSITATLTRRAFDRGSEIGEARLLALATLVAWHETPDGPDGRARFAHLGEKFATHDNGSGAAAAGDWLLDPGLSSRDWELVDDGIHLLKARTSGVVDWEVEAAYCLSGDQRGGFLSPSMLLARSVARLIDLPAHSSVGCLFSSSASLAWALARDYKVTLYADRYLPIMLHLLAHAAGRPLNVRRENPLDGSFSPAPYVRSGGSPPFHEFDFIVSVPPFGAKIQDGPDKGMAFESYQTQALAGRAKAAFYTIVPDAALFREVEAKGRERLVSDFTTTVLSLPAGMFLPTAHLSTCLMRLERGATSTASLIDGRTLEAGSTGRPQDAAIAQHLDAFRGLHTDEPSRTATVTIDELADNNFSLLPDRYLKSEALAAIDQMLARRHTVTLEDVAVIERGKAPTPLRESNDDPAVAALEIAPADLIDGVVRTPTRSQAFDAKEAARVKGVTVRADDILVSIKGNVGNIGIVEDPGVHLASAMGEPWIVAQSLAIIRLQPNPHIRSSAVLAALLTAPWVREKLESMSGASTVRTLPLSALRSLTLPVPTAEECAEAEKTLAVIADVRDQIADHQRNLMDSRRQLWSHLWQIPDELGDE